MLRDLSNEKCVNASPLPRYKPSDNLNYLLDILIVFMASGGFTY